METETPSFGAVLRRHRLAAGLTQEALAERAGLSARNVQGLERGENLPQRETLRRLAEALGLGRDEQQQFAAAARLRAHTGPPAPLGGVAVSHTLPTARPGAIERRDSRTHNLPVQATTFIGRERQLAALRALLARPEVRVVTLTGPGGIGKTRLALQVAAGLRDDFAQGVYLVPLAPVSDPALVDAMVAQVLGLREAYDQPLREILVGYLRDKEVLLILDNFEQVVSAAPLVGLLLAASPLLKVLVTSRMVLHVYGEQEFAVPPLALPPLRHLPAIDLLAHYEAVALFIQRAQLAMADFAVTAENAPAVAEICARLDGLPLAIELAAARVKLLPPQALLLRLDRRFAVLTGGAHDLPGRQQTLRKTIDWSYNLLDPGEQTLFVWLSVFVGGCTLEAVEDVCARAGGVPDDVLDGLSSLLDKSLLSQEEDATRGEPRFLMLETLRAYARERLAQSGAEGALRAAHAAYCLALAEQAEPHLTGAKQATWLGRLEAEHDNLRAALRWALESEAHLEVGLRMAGAVWRFWYGRGYLSEGRSWLEGLLGWTGAQESCVVAPAVRAKVLNGAGVLAQLQGDYARATVLLEESVALFREVGDTRGSASSLNLLGIVAREQGQYARATVLLEESVALFREVGDTWGIASSLNLLGTVARDQGEYAQATVLNEESLALFREVGDTWGIATAFQNLGLAAHGQGEYARATVLLEEALSLARGVGNPRGIAIALSSLGLVARAQGEYARATVLLKEGLSLLREVGNQRGMVLGLEWLASVALAPETASEVRERTVRLLGAAAALRAAIGVPLPPNVNLADHERTVAAMRDALGDVSFEVAWVEGQALTLEEAITLALGPA
jgi:predicted ATPase/DNA-binding XRE family transcriptional regulator